MGIIGVIGNESAEKIGSEGSEGNLENLGRLGTILKLLKHTSHPPYSTHSHHANCRLDTCLLAQAFAGLTHPQAPASAGDVSRGFASGEVAGTTDCGLRK